MLNESWYTLIEYFVSDPSARVKVKSLGIHNKHHTSQTKECSKCEIETKYCKRYIQGLRNRISKWHYNELAIELNLNMNRGSSKTGKENTPEKGISKIFKNHVEFRKLREVLDCWSSNIIYNINVISGKQSETQRAPTLSEGVICSLRN